MNILLTNDDGIYAEGIYAVYLELKKIGKVTVVAPDSQKSSVGHGITLAHPIREKSVKRKGRFFGYGVSGTPADCVKFAISVIMKKKPDLVVSGINWGDNDGCSVFYSGTVAAAREGALLGISSIAISLATFSKPNFKYAAQYCAKLAKLAFQNGMPKGTFLNINVPAVHGSKIKGIRFTKQGLIPIHASFRKRKDLQMGEYYWMSGKFPPRKKDLSVDSHALYQNYVTVTPIQSDETDYAYLQQLNQWKV